MRGPTKALMAALFVAVALLGSVQALTRHTNVSSKQAHHALHHGHADSVMSKMARAAEAVKHHHRLEEEEANTFLSGFSVDHTALNPDGWKSLDKDGQIRSIITEIGAGHGCVCGWVYNKLMSFWSGVKENTLACPQACAAQQATLNIGAPHTEAYPNPHLVAKRELCLAFTKEVDSEVWTKSVVGASATCTHFFPTTATFGDWKQGHPHTVSPDWNTLNFIWWGKPKTKVHLFNSVMGLYRIAKILDPNTKSDDDDLPDVKINFFIQEGAANVKAMVTALELDRMQNFELVEMNTEPAWVLAGTPLVQEAPTRAKIDNIMKHFAANHKYAFAKDLFALLVMYSQGGYLLDTNVAPLSKITSKRFKEMLRAGAMQGATPFPRYPYSNGPMSPLMMDVRFVTPYLPINDNVYASKPEINMMFHPKRNPATLAMIRDTLALYESDEYQLTGDELPATSVQVLGVTDMFTDTMTKTTATNLVSRYPEAHLTTSHVFFRTASAHEMALGARKPALRAACATDNVNMQALVWDDLHMIKCYANSWRNDAAEDRRAQSVINAEAVEAVLAAAQGY